MLLLKIIDTILKDALVIIICAGGGKKQLSLTNFTKIVKYVITR